MRVHPGPRSRLPWSRRSPFAAPAQQPAFGGGMSSFGATAGSTLGGGSPGLFGAPQAQPSFGSATSTVPFGGQVTRRQPGWGGPHLLSKGAFTPLR